MTGESDTGTPGPRRAWNGRAWMDRRPRDLALRRATVATGRNGGRRGGDDLGRRQAPRVLDEADDQRTVQPLPSSRQPRADNQHYVNSARPHRLYGVPPRG